MIRGHSLWLVFVYGFVVLALSMEPAFLDRLAWILLLQFLSVISLQAYMISSETCGYTRGGEMRDYRRMQKRLQRMLNDA